MNQLVARLIWWILIVINGIYIVFGLMLTNDQPVVVHYFVGLAVFEASGCLIGRIVLVRLLNRTSENQRSRVLNFGMLLLWVLSLGVSLWGFLVSILGNNDMTGIFIITVGLGLLLMNSPWLFSRLLERSKDCN